MERRRSLHGRRKGKPLSPRRAGADGRRLPGARARPRRRRRRDRSPRSFRVPVDDVRLEIGFGGGEHLVAEAAAAPGTGFIGVEPFVEGWRRPSPRIADGGLAQRPPPRRRRGPCSSTGCRRHRSTGSTCSIPTRGRSGVTGSGASSSPENLDRIARVLTPGRPVPRRERHRRLHRLDALPPDRAAPTSRGRPSAPTTGGSRSPAGRARATRQRRSPPGDGRPTSPSGGCEPHAPAVRSAMIQPSSISGSGTLAEQLARIGMLRVGEDRRRVARLDQLGPPSSTATRSQSTRTTDRSWLMKTSVRLNSSRSRRRRRRICAWVETSRPETISSATMNSGSSASARAMPTRWRWPPESSCG